MKRFLSVWLGMLAIVLLAGCQFAKPINWNARVGNYTFDQAVIELGPPDSQAKLSDGRVVAKWVSRYSSGSAVVVGGGLYSNPYGMSVVETTPGYFESKLVLTFNTNSVLAAWSKK